MSENAEVVPLQETASFDGHKLSDDDDDVDVMMTSVELSFSDLSTIADSGKLLFLVGVRVTPN